MADANSTLLNADKNSTESYSDFVRDFSFQLFAVKALLAGARALVYENEELNNENQGISDAGYILHEAVERIDKLAVRISDTQFSYKN